MKTVPCADAKKIREARRTIRELQARIEDLEKERDILSGRLSNALARIRALKPDGWQPWPGEAIPPCNGPCLITLWHYGGQLTVETGWYAAEHREFFADHGHEISLLHVRAWRGMVKPYTAPAAEGKHYPAEAGCTRHVGEPWPCPKCAALAAEEKKPALRPVDDNGDLVAYEGLGRNPPERRADLTSERQGGNRGTKGT